VGAEAGDQLAFGVGVRRGDHPGAGARGQLDHLVADPTGRADDQDRVAGLECGAVYDAVRRGPGQAERGGVGEGDGLGQRARPTAVGTVTYSATEPSPR
jgi:hypothetical protein